MQRGKFLTIEGTEGVLYSVAHKCKRKSIYPVEKNVNLIVGYDFVEVIACQ